MGTKTIWYGTNGSEQRFALSIPESWDAARPREQQTIAELCAQDFHDEHDGWESSWPREFVLYRTEGSEPFARLDVDREAIPQFTARHVQANAGIERQPQP